MELEVSQLKFKLVVIQNGGLELGLTLIKNNSRRYTVWDK